MYILETCPICGGYIDSIVICTYPPILVKNCKKCSWKWEISKEEVISVPFNPEGYGNASVQPLGTLNTFKQVSAD